MAEGLAISDAPHAGERPALICEALTPQAVSYLPCKPLWAPHQLGRQMDWQKLKESVQLSPGEKITIEAKGQVVEMTATGLTIREHILTSAALQHALAAHQITKEIRNALVYPCPDTEAIKKLACDLIDAGELLQRWAEQ